MINQKKIIGLGTLSYIISIIILLLSSYVIFILLGSNEDWELFSFNFFAAIGFYGLSILLLTVTSFIIKKLKIDNIIFLILLLILLEISSLIIAKDSITLRIFSTMIEDKNWILLMYPIAVILSFFISKRILKIDLSQSN